VDFDAIDNNPVDILFILVVPEKSCDQHLETLANLAKLMDNAEYRNQLRQAITNKELFEYAINMQD
jgi:PTS system nitrogen regulatory IIA component